MAVNLDIRLMTIELLAIVFAKEQFRPYLYGRKFTVITDHEPLKHFQTTKNPDLRFNRLKAALRGYSFDVIYQPGLCNQAANAFSRSGYKIIQLLPPTQ